MNKICDSITSFCIHRTHYATQLYVLFYKINILHFQKYISILKFILTHSFF